MTNVDYIVIQNKIKPKSQKSIDKSILDYFYAE